jgi:hypothetical protein
VTRIAGYAVGGCLALGGALGLFQEFVDRNTSRDVVFGYALGAAMVFSGAAICIALGNRYRGGAWTLGGAILGSFGIVVGALALDNYLRDSRIPALIECLLVLVFVGLGSSCLLIGHLRHRRVAVEH